MKKMFLLSVSSALVLAACGGDETTYVTEVTESTGMDIVAEGEEMPACNGKNFGKMIFVMDSSAVFYCADKKWTTLNGKDGEPGAAAEAKDGTSCTAKEVDDGIEVSCGGEVVGTLKNVTSSQGCSAKEVDEGLEVSCEGKVVGTIKNGTPGEAGDNCSIASDKDGVVKLVCGSGENAKTTTVYKAMCGMNPYEPSTSFCDERDGRVYKYVKIGEQAWMAENLNYAYLRPTAELDSSSFCYDNDAANCETYGRLYLWSAAMDSAAVLLNDGKGKDCGYGVECAAKAPVQGVCPTGWHLPSKAEFEKLLAFVTGTATEKRDKLAAEEWNGEDVYGFAALPAGLYDSDRKKFVNLGLYVRFWSSTEGDSDSAYYLIINVDAVVYNSNKSHGRSIRCLKD